MAATDLRQSTTSSMNSLVPNFKVSAAKIDEAMSEETYWENPYWSEYLGYYNKIPELKQAINSLAIWTAGKGYETDDKTRIELDNITGWGEDSFQSIMKNMLVVKKVNGDSYAEIIRDSKAGDLLNIKILNPLNVRTIVNKKGIIEGYDEYNPETKSTRKRFKPQEILHLVNDRVANQIHGTSVIEACKWVIDARNEAMSDWRRILHRSTIRVLEVDSDDPTTLTTLKNQYAEAIRKGEVLILPKDNATFADLQAPPSETFLGWIRYLENFFYQAVGIPKIILGGSQEFTEASSKIGYLTFEQVYMAEQRELESDLWNQLGIKITFNRPVSLKDDVVTSEAANTGQVGFQPNEAQVGVSRTE
jgi:hypothetical protein